MRQIERIANSTDPQRAEYLTQAATLPNISELESDAITVALESISDGGRVHDLIQLLRDKEASRIRSSLPASSDPLLRPILLHFKTWRYVNRRSHPQYDKVNEFIALALIRGLDDERTLSLSRELEAELE